MREILEGYPEVVERAREAIRRAGLTPIERPIRGGTDGSRLSFMGLPTPNLFAGEHNFHSRLEWVSAQDMDKAVETIVNLCRVWEERTVDSPATAFWEVKRANSADDGHDHGHATPLIKSRLRTATARTASTAASSSWSGDLEGHGRSGHGRPNRW